MTLSSSFSFSSSSSSLTSLEPSTPPPKKTTTGFRELAKSDARFEPYARTLFARPTSANDPDALEGPLARRLDASLAAFARLVGPRLPEPAAARALEYLVRRFRIGSNGVSGPALIAAALPHPRAFR